MFPVGLGQSCLIILSCSPLVSVNPILSSYPVLGFVSFVHTRFLTHHALLSHRSPTRWCWCWLRAAECMDLLEEMERQQKGLSDENAVLRTENDSYLSEIERLSAILAAREQELLDLKGVSAAEETF